MKKEVLLIGLLIITTLAMGQNASGCHSDYSKDLRSHSDEALGNEFKKLRALNDPACDIFDSDLHRIMVELGKRLGQKGMSQEYVLKIMGEYDDSGETGRDLVTVNQGEKLWVYHWRGWHDWLYIVLENNKVKRCDWYFAYE